MLLGNGAGGFGAKTDFATGTEPFSVAIGDVNGDGAPDLVTANSSANTVSVLLGLVKTRTAVSPMPNVAVLGSPVTLIARVSIRGRCRDMAIPPARCVSSTASRCSGPRP